MGWWVWVDRIGFWVVLPIEPTAPLTNLCRPLFPQHPPQAANIYGGFLQRRLQEATDEALKALDAVRSLRRLQLGPSDSMAEDADINVRAVLASFFFFWECWWCCMGGRDLWGAEFLTDGPTGLTGRMHPYFHPHPHHTMSPAPAPLQAPEQDSQPHVTGLNRVLGEASRVIGLLRGDAYYYDDPDSQPPAPPAMMAAPQGLVSPACLARMIQALNEIALKQAVKLLKVGG